MDELSSRMRARTRRVALALGAVLAMALAAPAGAYTLTGTPQEGDTLQGVVVDNANLFRPLPPDCAGKCFRYAVSLDLHLADCPENPGGAGNVDVFVSDGWNHEG